MADSFFSDKIIGKMKPVGKSGVIHGSPMVKEGVRSDSFYTKARYGAAPVKTTGGIPGGRSGMANLGKDSGSDPGAKGSSNKRDGGHSYISSGPLSHGG